MKKAITIYSKISCAIFIIIISLFIISATVNYFYRDINNQYWSDSHVQRIFDKTIEILLYFTMYNGIFLLATGVYLLFQKKKVLGILSIALPIIFYGIIFYSMITTL